MSHGIWAPLPITDNSHARRTMGLLGNASLSSYLPSSDAEEEFLKSSQPCDVGNPAVDETCK
jgi:hypothetical protein